MTAIATHQSPQTGTREHEQPAPPLRFTTLYVEILATIRDQPKQRIAQEKLARLLDVTMRTIQRHLDVLETSNIVKVDRSSKPFSYTIDYGAHDGLTQLRDVIDAIPAGALR